MTTDLKKPKIEPLGLSANQWKFLSAPEKYVEASKKSGRKLVIESTKRQFVTAQDILARLNGSLGGETRRGILLADDVGLGKTTVAALVAWVVASAGEKRTVRILAPNDVMRRRWLKELRSHVLPIRECAHFHGAGDIQESCVKDGKGRLAKGMIQVLKHSYAASGRLHCDLLIVDEAHRAKGAKTDFSKALGGYLKKHAGRVLILTATPFSICVDELKRMLTLIGAKAAHKRIDCFERELKNLYSGNTAQSPEVIAKSLATNAKAVVDALSTFVIRHGIDDISCEQKSFGKCKVWKIPVPTAEPKEMELLLRIDRALRVAKNDGETKKVTNDARFHVGYKQFDEEIKNLKNKVPHLTQPAQDVVRLQLKAIKKLRSQVTVHSKIKAVGKVVKSVVEHGEKVVLFCDYHATAQELTAHLATVLPVATMPQKPAVSVWKEAWKEILASACENEKDHNEILLNNFIDWLCTDLIRTQTWSWLGTAPTSEMGLVRVLKMKKTMIRHNKCPETVATAAQQLYKDLLNSKSSRTVLKNAGKCIELLPGANGTSRVLGVCEPSKNKNEGPLFYKNQQPDTVISIFNSPFGPDVLVVTDRLSEGIDLHRYCRHLIHYELDPSPIRTVQRNGRIRRVNSWASVTDQPIRYGYPSFGGTRDHRLVQIMENRLASFSLLLGGVHDIDVEQVVGSEEEWRNKVIKIAADKLKKAGRQLIARVPGGK